MNSLNKNSERAKKPEYRRKKILKIMIKLTDRIVGHLKKALELLKKLKKHAEDIREIKS